MSDINSRGYANADALVSTDWVAKHGNDDGVQIVESNEDPLLYPSGHIPGAVEIDWAADLNDPLRRDYLDRDGFANLMSSKGHIERHDRRSVRRPQQLVGLLRALDLPTLRSYQREDHGRRAHEVGSRRSRTDPRRTERRICTVQRARTRRLGRPSVPR